MSHVGNKIKAGFFATPSRQGEYLTKLLEVEGSLLNYNDMMRKDMLNWINNTTRLEKMHNDVRAYLSLQGDWYVFFLT